MQKRLFIGTGGYVLCVDATTGAELWRTALDSHLLSSTTHRDVTVLDDAEHLFAGSAGHLYCLNSDTGAILWKNDLHGLGFQNVCLSINGAAVEILTKIEPL